MRVTNNKPRLTIRLYTLLVGLLLCYISIAVYASPIPNQSQQMLLVITPAFNNAKGTLYRFERSNNGPWQKIQDAIPINVGQKGMAWGLGLHPELHLQPIKKEGDGKSPAGIFQLSSVFGFAPREHYATLRMPYQQVTHTLVCIDDPKSSLYNTLVDKRQVAKIDWHSAENMHDYTQYHLGIVIDHNPSRIPGKGSCLFLHLWKDPNQGTGGGCTAMSLASLKTILNWLDTNKMPILVQLPRTEYVNLRHNWQLPVI